MLHLNPSKCVLLAMLLMLDSKRIIAATPATFGEAIEVPVNI
jgi:hypothetical protein